MAWTEPPRTWVSEEIVTAAIMNTHVKDQLIFLGGVHKHGGANGDGGTIVAIPAAIPKSLWCPANGAFGTGAVDHLSDSSWGGVGFADGQINSTIFSFPLPADFNTLIKLVVLIHPQATGNVYRTVDTIASADAELDSGGHAGSIALIAVAVVDNTMKADDVSAALSSSAAALDYVTMVYQRDAVDALDTHSAQLGVIGMLLEYTAS